MTGKERLRAVLRGDKVDRVPLWTREGLEYKGYENMSGNFMNSWKTEKEYIKICDRIYSYADVISEWSFYPVNRYLLVPEKNISVSKRIVKDKKLILDCSINVKGEPLKSVIEFTKDQATSWTTRYPVNDMNDLMKLIDVPFEMDSDTIDKSFGSYEKKYDEIGDKGLIRWFISSPVVIISGCMPFELFLELSSREKSLMHELLAEVTRRETEIIDAVFKNSRPDIFVTLGGSEQCTPPMMSPDCFYEYVVPYDKMIIDRLKKYGVYSTCHCHGKVRNVLKGMIEAGYVGTDPLEPPPSGDISIREGKILADGKLTIFGNLEWSEMVYSDPGHIKNRVIEILSGSKRRLVVSTSAGPISSMDMGTIENYRMLVDTMMEYGQDDGGD